MADNINKYKTQLESLLADITKALEAISIHNPNNVADWVEDTADIASPEADPNDVADLTEEWDERRATTAVLETRFNNICRALKKIEDGTFGTCEVCGGPIEANRLDANPAARTDKAHMEEENLGT
jgi:RNA polymerase-binding transcription factor DksA